jgi:hypothetical protein
MDTTNQPVKKPNQLAAQKKSQYSGNPPEEITKLAFPIPKSFE